MGCCCPGAGTTGEGWILDRDAGIVGSYFTELMLARGFVKVELCSFGRILLVVNGCDEFAFCIAIIPAFILPAVEAGNPFGFGM